jgi:hypothetical protein
MKEKCIDCGCDDAIQVAPCLDPTGCPEPQKCDQIFDTDCILYNGSNIECNDNTIISSGDTVSQALEAIVDLACSLAGSNPDATITANNDNTLTVAPTGGLAPYTYQWSIEQGVFNGHTIASGATASTVTLTPITGNTLVVGGVSGSTGAVNMTHLKVVVTDSANKKVTKYYTYAKLV